jgi:DNA-binding transcriptional LysR family regulator
MTWQWDDVRFFLAVARAGSLSGAARVLGVGHVTVGRRIALLEKRLGVTLLQRTPGGFDVTSAGETVLRRCIAMENAALDLERAAAGRDSLAVGSIRLTATEALAHRVIAPAIAELRKNHPDLRVDLAAGVRSLDITRREADLAVRVGRPSGSGLVCRKLGEVGYSLYASPSYLAKHRTPQRREGLAGHDLITFTGAPAATSPFFMNESLDEARIALRCDNPLIQAAAAANGIGIAELACFLGDDCAELVRIWPAEPPALRSVWLVLHEDLRRSARIRVVSSIIGDAFHRQRKILQYGRPA